MQTRADPERSHAAPIIYFLIFIFIGNYLLSTNPPKVATPSPQNNMAAGSATLHAKLS